MNIRPRRGLCRFELDGFFEDVRRGSDDWFVFHLPNARDLICIRIMPGVDGKPACNMQVLAREVLMDKEEGG